MRIIAGSAKGRTLKSPRGMRTRPTSDRVREALFSIIGERVRDAGVLDLYAGTGGLGLEALSRGAAWTVFVEKDRSALDCLRKNVSLCGFEERSKVVSAPVLSFLKGSVLPREVDIVFVDPPYYGDEGPKVLRGLTKHVKSLSETFIVYEHSPGSLPDPIPDGLKAIECRRFGDTSIQFFCLHKEGS